MKNIVTSLDIDKEEISGFLGNQLFRFATVLGYAYDNGKVPLLPEWKYSKFLKYDFSNVGTFSGFYNYDEPFFHYSEIPRMESINLCGYFQSWKYFERAKTNVLSAISLKNEYWGEIYASNKNSLKIPFSQILSKKTCAIHRRAGDYLNLQGHFYNLLTSDYYRQCYEKLKDGVDYFLVFSNDIEESKRYFNWSDKFVFVEFDQNKQQGNNVAILELFLMSKCDKICIANSSFSWWAAYLHNDGGDIYYPSKWFGPLLKHDTKDLIPKEWKVIKC